MNEGTRGLPEYKRNPDAVLFERNCEHCGAIFLVARKYPCQRFCSRKCGFQHLNPPDHNARVARKTIRERADRMRGKGDRKAYRKLYGRHAHRVIAEQKLGRALRRGEVVSFADHDRFNIDPANLIVHPNRSAFGRWAFGWSVF
jgi:hypothetical protein